MEFFRDTKIDFMKYRKYFVMLSLTLLAVGMVAVFFHGKLNLGIDFAGGTQLTLKFREQPEIDELRDVVAAAGIAEAQIQRFGEEGANEVIIKTPTVEGQEEGTRNLVVDALSARYQTTTTGNFDLNQRGSDALADLLLALDPDELRATDEQMAAEHYENVALMILEQRRDEGLLVSWDEITGIPEVSTEVATALEQNAYLGQFAVLGAENVGPQIGAELRRKGILAVLASLVGMLIYIWFRFELRFGVGALVALSHDVLIVLGLFTLMGFEFNLTTIAAFLTLVGYSVNDTVVVFDRVRENLRRSRRKPLVDTINQSLNQTLSRTVLTSGTTILVVGSLFLLGGDVLRGFAFILTVGVTYSSIYVASPFTLLWEQIFGREARLRRKEA
ncbi:MAG: protein translocase subunit SecF [Acidobacteria bacterium]|nr:MAG: protein translocase subunit SecF [Acidobacteriota bacterium]